MKIKKRTRRQYDVVVFIVLLLDYLFFVIDMNKIVRHTLSGSYFLRSNRTYWFIDLLHYYFIFGGTIILRINASIITGLDIDMMKR